MAIDELGYASSDPNGHTPTIPSYAAITAQIINSSGRSPTSAFESLVIDW